MGSLVPGTVTSFNNLITWC